MSPWSNMEGSHRWRHIHRRSVEAQRREAPIEARGLGQWKVAVGGLIRRARQRDIRAQFDDLVIISKHLTTQLHPRGVGHQVDKSAQPFGIQLDVKAAPSPKGNTFSALNSKCVEKLK